MDLHLLMRLHHTFLVNLIRGKTMVIGKNKKKRQARAEQRNIQRLLQESLDRSANQRNELQRQMVGGV